MYQKQKMKIHKAKTNTAIKVKIDTLDYKNI